MAGRPSLALLASPPTRPPSLLTPLYKDPPESQVRTRSGVRGRKSHREIQPLTHVAFGTDVEGKEGRVTAFY